MEVHMPEGPDNSASPSAPQNQEPGPQTPNWDSDDNPWKKNFESYRTEADRRATTLSAYESHLEDLRSYDIERQRNAARALGVTLVEDELEYDDPTDALAAALAQTNAQLAEIEQREAAREAAQKAADEQAALAERIDAKLKGMGLSETDGDIVLARAITLGKTADGLPDLAAAHAELVARDQAAMVEWAKTKRTASIAPGITGTETKSIADMSDDERLDWVLARHDLQ